jgi:UDP-N-acetyl-D-galactosamine dehydrogenase
MREYDETLQTTLPAERYAAVIVAVAHEPFKALGAAGLRGLCVDDGVLFDVKAILAKDEADGRL